jgi:hypothetical protein
MLLVFFVLYQAVDVVVVVNTVAYACRPNAVRRTLIRLADPLPAAGNRVTILPRVTHTSAPNVESKSSLALTNPSRQTDYAVTSAAIAAVTGELIACLALAALCLRV